MTDPRVAVVAGVLDTHQESEMNDYLCRCGWECEWSDQGEVVVDHSDHQAVAVLAALDDYATTHPFAGRIPPVREWSGLDEFHADTTSNPEA